MSNANSRSGKFGIGVEVEVRKTADNKFWHGKRGTVAALEGKLIKVEFKQYGASQCFFPRELKTCGQTKKAKALAAIAKKHFRISTLKTQKRDSLDFHEVSVWDIVEALEAAFKLGADSQNR